MSRLSLLCTAVAFATAAGTACAAPLDTYRATVEAYYDSDFKAHPVFATHFGVHEYDTQLGDFSAAAVKADIARLHHFSDTLKQVHRAALPPHDRDDLDVLLGEIDGQLLEEEDLQRWRNDPGQYVHIVGGALFALISHDFAPLPQRMADVIAREKQMPRLFAQAKANLAEMPPVFVQIASLDAAGIAHFVRADVPAAFDSVSDPALKSALALSTKQAADAVDDFRKWLVAQAPNAHGSFVLGRERLQRLLATDLVHESVDTVLAAGRAQLARDVASLNDGARRLNVATPEAAVELIGHDHTTAANLLPSATEGLAALQAFVENQKIVTLPFQDLPRVIPTPPFARTLITAAMDWPGPREMVATDAFYFVTPPDTTKPAAEQEKYLEYFNQWSLEDISSHEVMPGHFTQYLFRRAHREWPLQRQAAHSYTTTEGWAHYAEQMMVEQGLEKGNPKYEVAQATDAILRDCRLIAAMTLHTGTMTLDQVTDMLEHQCYQPHALALREARRGTSDPGYYAYALGKLMILKLRADMKASEGSKFSLTSFHDRFLSSGLVPVAIIRREMTGKDGPML